jgi:hypothetical protein
MIDRLDAMQAFVGVCDARGFAAAARKLELSTYAALAKLESARFVTGEILHVDGGQSAGH